MWIVEEKTATKERRETVTETQELRRERAVVELWEKMVFFPVMNRERSVG